ncbi:hypothetical protein Tco_1254579 [Tanacetum coccineum]
MTPFEVRSFLGLAGYNRRFIKNISKIAKPLTLLTQKNQKYEWGEKQEEAFQMLEDMLRVCVIDFGRSWNIHLPLAKFSYNNSYHLSIRYAPFEALYERKCRSPVLWAEIGDSGLIGPELVQETTDKMVVIRDRLKAARDRQKSYADNRRKPLEFQVGDHVMLKVSPWKGVVRLRLPEELSSVDKTLRFVEEPLKIMDREDKTLKRSKIPIVKVRWNFEHGPKMRFPKGGDTVTNEILADGFMIDESWYLWEMKSFEKLCVMAISVISVSSDSSEESVGTSTGRLILFVTIPTTIPDTTPFMIPPSTHIDTALTPTSPDYTPTSPDYTPASDTESDPSEDPSSDHIPPLPTISPFLSSTDDSSDSDTPDTQSSPTHGTPFTKMTLSTQSTPIASCALHRRVMILAPGQPIPHGRPYRYHLNGLVHMITMRKRVGPLPTHRLVVRHLVDYSSLDHFALDDSLRDLSSSSSSETSSDPSPDDLSDSSSGHSLPAPSSGMRPIHYLCLLVSSIPCSSAAISDRPSHDFSFVSPSRKKSRSPVVSVLLSSPISRALSYARVDLLPLPKTIRSPKSMTDLEIDECIAYADALRVKWIDTRVVVKAVDRKDIETSARGPVKVRVYRVTHLVIANDITEPAQEEGTVEVTYETLGYLVQRFHDHTKEILVCHIQAIKSVQKDQGHRIVETRQQSADMLERIRELERDNMRLRDMIDVASQRVTRSQRRELRVQREMRQIWRFRFYDRMRIVRLEAYARRHLGYRS